MPATRTPSHVSSYGLALAAVAGALLLRRALEPVLGDQIPFLFYFPAVMLAARYGGLRSGLVATALSGAGAAALLPGMLTSAEAKLGHAVGLGVFVLVGGAYSVLSERANAATERLRLAYEREQALQERLAVTLRSIGDAVIATDSAGVVTFLNPVAETLTGWDLAAAQGKPLDEVFVIVQEHTRRPVDSPVQRVIREGRTVGLANHTVLVSRTGVETSISDSAAPIRDLNGELVGVVLVFRDAAQERATERALQESAARFRQLADAMPQMVWTARPDGFIDYYNARWCDYTGCALTESGDASRRGSIHPDDLERWLERWARSVQRGEPYDIEYRLRSAREGGYRWFLGRALPVRDGSGAIVKWFGTCTDIHAQKSTEAALKDADRRKDQFLAMLSHELRNPLAPIRSAVELLKREGPMEPRLERARDIIDRQADQLTRLTDDLLEVSRITSGKIRLEEAVLDAASVVTLALETSAPLIEARGHSLDVRLPQETVHVRADGRRLAQVLGNILNNAAKFTQAGGHIKVTLEREGAEAVFRIEDDGPGIPADKLDEVFDMFAQVDRSLARSQGGLGLGLTLARALVEMHGGTVRASPRGPGQGTELVVRLPAAPRPAEPPGGPGSTDRGQAPASRVLVVDDNVDAADTLGELLELSGHEVRVAYDGTAALTLAAEFRPRLVLLDIGLPGLDGYEVARRLRERHGQTMVLVALTGYGQEEDQRRAKEAGFDRHLVKPLQPRTLTEVLAQLAPAVWPV